MHITIEQSIDDTDTDDIMKMLDDDIAAENSQVGSILDLPEVPTTKPTIATTTEKKTERRVAEMEWHVCLNHNNFSFQNGRRC